MQVKTRIEFTEKSAIFSEDKIYRYQLLRKWDGGNDKFCVWLMLNPSTADQELEDNTIRRCCLYAKDWGYSGIIILNIFAYRETSPKKMKSYYAPIGPENDKYILDTLNNPNVGIMIAGWGSHGSHLNRDKSIKKLLVNKKIYCLDKTKDGQPNHPLYLKKELLPQIWE